MTSEPNILDTSEPKSADAAADIGGGYSWYVLIVLIFVYVLNFIDRNILSILAEEIKADLGISDAQIGFLYGTAFAVFYAVFGIPLARVADVWTRKNLISIGLFFWSLMTALSGTARSLFALGAYRIGVGIGESSASPAAFSMLGDYFPPRMRATAVAVYSSGVYIGAGMGIFLGGKIVEGWNKMYPDGGAPFGIAAWQAAFFAVGIPGLIMAVWIWTLREPVRGQSEGIVTKESGAKPLDVLREELATVIPPFTLWSLHRIGAGQRGIALNVSFMAIYALLAYGLTALLGSVAQWTALSIGLYAVSSWIQALAYRDRPTFVMIFKSRAMIFAMTGFGFVAFKTYGIGFWLSPYFLRTHDVPIGEVATFIGLGSALGGWFGVTGGGILSDWLKRKTPLARIYCGILGSTITVPLVLFILMTDNVRLGYFAIMVDAAFSSMWIGSAVALANELVLPRMRATASSFYILMVTFIGLALGPYTMGRISVALEGGGMDSSDGIRYGMMIGMSSLVLAVICFVVAGRYVAADEGQRLERARAAGEPGI